MSDSQSLSKDEKIERIKILEEIERRKALNKISQYYPDKGPLRRELYSKHIQFFEAGAKYRERLMLAANRVGKTEGVGGFEMTCHLTGHYPNWWRGRVFRRPVEAWAAGDTGETVRDIIQTKLLGPVYSPGTGLIPSDLIVDTKPRSGIPDAKQVIYVRHATGGVSQLNLKSYDQKRKSFQGTKKDVIWLDEEPPLDIYDECYMRSVDTSGGRGSSGIMMLTFTPLMGMSDVVLLFLPGGEIQESRAEDSSKFVVMATWDDAPHLSREEKDELWKNMPPHQRDARSKGVPQLGSGAIYPVPDDDIIVDDFPIPDHWPRGYGMDVGWNRTSVGWHAKDPETNVIYRYSEHYRGEAEPSVHAEAVRGRGVWIPGVIDPAARGRGQSDGRKIMQDYKDLGLDLEIAFNGVESGIYRMWQMLSSGKYRVFRSCQNWIKERRLYRRDEKGRIVKENDHAMDESRYFIMSGIDRMKTKPVEKADDEQPQYISNFNEGSWMG